MLGESGGVGKGLAAVVAPVRSLPRMGSKVSRDRRTLREPFLADGTAERFLSAVRSEMCGEVSSLSERLPADLAVVWLLTTVCTHVRLECGGAGVALATHLTHVAS